MCGICGCGSVGTDHHEHHHNAEGASAHRGDHDSHHHHHHPDTAQSAIDDTTRLIQVEADILAHNDALAADNRRTFVEQGILTLNLVSSPGAGKTTLLERTLRDLKDRLPLLVVEGDQQTDLDASRIRNTGVRALQVNTGKGCHLDAAMIGDACRRLAPEPNSVLFIENVGNLVCPAGFDLGEAHKVVLASVTEGEDKPLKYPNMFAAASLMLVTKTDLLPHLDFDVHELTFNAKRINPALRIVEVSARNGQGLAAWFDWIEEMRHEPTAATVDAAMRAAYTA